jgi:hypothetical protein
MFIDDLEAIILRDANAGQRILDNLSNAFPVAGVVDFGEVDTNEGHGNSLLTDRPSWCSSYQHILTNNTSTYLCRLRLGQILNSRNPPL